MSNVWCVGRTFEAKQVTCGTGSKRGRGTFSHPPTVC